MAVYSALYRIWRPRRLADLVGQEHVTRTLRNALRAGHTAHAYLFCGPRGTGKTSTARILAAALNCQNASDGDACGTCPACLDVAADRLIDVQEIDAASNRQVDDMRALRETVGYAPAAGRHKVYILDEVHMLTEASWNTLLKTLEEPPPATTFVLCTTDPRKVLATVVSRCQRFDFRRLTVAEIVAHLERICLSEGIPAEAEALQALARRADGGLRDAISTLDQATAFVRDGTITAGEVAQMLGAADDAAVERLLTAVRTGDTPALFAEVERLYAEGKDMGQVLRDILAGLRDRLVAQLGDKATRGNLGAARPGADALWLVWAIGALAELEGQLRRTEQPRLLLEVALVRLLAGGAEVAGTPPQPSEASVPPVPARGGASTAGDAGREPVGPPRPAAPAAQATPPPAAASGPEPAWDALLEAVRQISAPAHSALQHGQYRGRHGAAARVSFRNQAHAALAEARRDVLERAWLQLTGAPVKFELSVDGAPAVQTTPPPAKGRSRPEGGLRGSGAPTMPPPAEADSGPHARGGGRVRGDSTAGEADARFQKALTLFQGTPLTAHEP